MNRSFKWFARLVIVTVLFGTVSLGTTYAYTVWGPKWPGGNPSYGADSSFSNSGFGWASRLGDAVAEWNAVSSTNNWAFWFRADNGSGNRVQSANLQNDSRCRPDPSKPACLAITVKQKALFSNDYTKFTLIVNTGSGYPYYDGTQTTYLPGNYYDLRTLLRHELGHALGLCHSANSSAVMALGQTPGTERPLQADDRNGLRYLYWPGYTLTTPSGACIN